MKYLKRFENSQTKELCEISGQYLVNLTDNGYIIKYGEDRGYFNIDITHVDLRGLLKQVDWDFISDDVITYIQYITSTMNGVNFDLIGIESYTGFTSYIYQNKIDALINGENIKIANKNNIRRVEIIFRIGPR